MKARRKPASNSGCLSNIPMKCHCHMERVVEGERRGGEHDLMENGLLYPCSGSVWRWWGTVCMSNVHRKCTVSMRLEEHQWDRTDMMQDNTQT